MMTDAQGPSASNTTSGGHESVEPSSGKEAHGGGDAPASVHSGANAGDRNGAAGASSATGDTEKNGKSSAEETLTDNIYHNVRPMECETAVLFCGSNKWNSIGRSSVPRAVQDRGGSDEGNEYLTPTRLTFPQIPSVRFKTVISGPCAVHLVLLSETGDAYTLGRNENGQLACPDLLARSHPVHCSIPSPSPDPIVNAACGRSHTLLVTKSGACYAAGLNSSGQLGIGSVPNTREPNVVKWTRVTIPPNEKVVSVAAGADFSVWACASGSLYSAGNGQYGQLGNGRTGERILATSRVSYDVVSSPQLVPFPGPDQISIVQVASGSNHTVALDSRGKVWSWGFGGYGRLGHCAPNDELRPRQIDTLNRPHFQIEFVSCGATSSFAVVKRTKTTYFWGISSKSRESFMYPKPLFDLQGHEVHCLGSGATSTVLATERTVVSWGPSPTFGELGYGKGQPKSSTKPKIVEPVEDLYCRSIAVGVAFTVLIVHIESDDDKKTLGKLVEEEWGMNQASTKRKATKDTISTKQPISGKAKGGKRRKKQ